MSFDLAQIVVVALIGLLAGTLGGLAGIGGSMIIIPGLGLLLGYSESHAEQHLYMAAAMAVNLLVAIPAAARHRQAGAVRWDLVRVLLPAMLVTIVLGVLLSNAIDGLRLKQFLAIFIFGYCVLNIARIFASQIDYELQDERTRVSNLVITSGATGLISGLLGLGGGVIMVPLLQVLCRLRLRKAIATTLAVMAFTAAVGGTLKLATLPSHDESIADALVLVLAMAPLALAGGHLGAALTHALPLKAVRVVVSILLSVVAAKLWGLF